SCTPEGRTISLYEHDGSYSIRVDSVDLMSTRQHVSEEKLAELACSRLKIQPAARVLVGGLGMGFTLNAALALLAPEARVTVAEILPCIVAWNRNPAYPFAGDAMNDPRVTVLEQDVVETIANSPTAFDSIVLDVDNGPAALTAEGNSRLYGEAGLRLIRAALKPSGCAAFWSAAPNAPFEKLFARCGFTVEVHRWRSHRLFIGVAREL
ncbi:MAG TPA: hypothetical protein VFC21_05895, partial [Bryobacteraceae bacterium]|nr:hypothetical protein [Bryobacteraceae bacterium]